MQVPCTKNDSFGIRYYFKTKNIKMEISKTDSLQIWPALKNIKKMQKLLKLVGFRKT